MAEGNSTKVKRNHFLDFQLTNTESVSVDLSLVRKLYARHTSKKWLFKLESRCRSCLSSAIIIVKRYKAKPSVQRWLNERDMKSDLIKSRCKAKCEIHHVQCHPLYTKRNVIANFTFKLWYCLSCRKTSIERYGGRLIFRICCKAVRHCSIFFKIPKRWRQQC